MPTTTVGTFSRLPRAFIAASRLTVLLLLAAGHNIVWALEDNTVGPRRFEFTCEFQLSMGRGHVEGAMASDGSRHRITIYWTEPDVFREGTEFIRYIDSIFTPDSVSYWIYPGDRHGTLLLETSGGDPLSPRDKSVDSIVRSALAIVSQIRPQGNDTETPLEIGRFFRSSRGLAEYAHKAQPNEADGNDPSAADANMEVLSSLPSGREYLKESREDSVTRWRISKALSNTLVSVVTIKPAAEVRTADGFRLFGTDTLGQSVLTPEAYRAYWSFDRALLELAESTDRPASARALCTKFDSCLRDGNPPLEVRRGMYRLWFKAALRTEDTGCLRTCIQAAVAGVREDTPFGNYRGLLELARCSGEIQTQFPQDPQEWLRPLVGEMVKRASRDVGYCFARLMPMIDMNKWFVFGEFFLDEIRSQGLLEEAALRDLAVRFEATRAAREWRAWDPCEASPRVREYLARIDSTPPKGSIDMETLGHILEEGLATACTGAGPQTKQSLVNDVIGSLRLIVGEGPFQGDAGKLTESIARFSERFRKAYGAIESIEPVLATFLGLSFCDLSAAKDHDALLAQLARQSAELQSQVNAALGERGVSPLVTVQEVADTFRRYEQCLPEYVNDPLWPTHKFALTKGEESMLAGRLTLSLLQQEPLFDDVALKFKYGGESVELKNALIWGVSSVAQQFVSETGFIRRPSYPGILCDYQARQGFTTMIEGPLYEEGKRPREIFKAMKYFHLGQRLNDVVQREQELATRAKTQEASE